MSTKLTVTNNIEENEATALVNIFGRTDVGKSRDHNEDNFAIGQDVRANEWEFNQHALKLGSLGSVMVVADGMGGTNAGEVASEIMVNTAKQMFQKLQKLPESNQGCRDFLKKVITASHKNILIHSTQNPSTEGMGTTAVIAWMISHKAHIAWAGDSRAYLYRKGVPLYPATDDHSMVWEMVQNGHLTPNQARVHPQSNIITQSLGDDRNPPHPEAKTLKLQTGDRLMLCSDGLNGELDDPEIEAILQKKQGTPETCQELVNQANLAGGSDNITVLLMDALDMPGADSNTENRDTSDKNTKISPQKKLILLGISLTILVLSSYLLASNIGSKKQTKGATEIIHIAKGVKKIIPIPDTTKRFDTTDIIGNPAKVDISSVNRPKDTIGTTSVLKFATNKQIAALEVRLDKLLNAKAVVLKKITTLKINYKEIPGELNKLKEMQKRLTDKIASPLIVSKIMKTPNGPLKKPRNKAEYNKILHTIQRVEDNLVDIQEKMRHWSLSKTGGGN